jgi:protein-S-isoprenylcysteine O-methyltransferase Ste14
MYVGVLLVIAGWALLFQSPRVLGYGAAVALLFHLFVVAVEEPSLRGKFGNSYGQYCREVRRWVPRIGRGRSA